MLTGSDNSAAVYDETVRSAAAFRILRQMVACWLRDVSVYQNELADQQIVHFYRWLHDSNSLMYEPALHRILRSLMQKLFLHLIAEFKRLGAIIVHANFNKIILCTRKKKTEDAITYVQYIVNSIRGKELFHSIDISFNQCWEYIMWLDPSNHGGVKGEISKDAPQSSQDSTEEIDEDDPIVVMNWNMANYLPIWCESQYRFNISIKSYIYIMYKKLKEDMTRYTPGDTPMKRRVASQVTQEEQPPATLTDSNKTYAQFAREFVAGDVAQKLFFITQKIFKRGMASREVMEEEQRFLLTTSHQHFPALQFVKCITKVLSLDSTVEQEVIIGCKE